MPYILYLIFYKYEYETSKEIIKGCIFSKINKTY